MKTESLASLQSCRSLDADAQCKRALTLHSHYFQYVSLYTQKTGHIPPRFEKLVKLSGTHLTQYVYAMITYVQVGEYPRRLINEMY